MRALGRSSQRSGDRKRWARQRDEQSYPADRTGRQIVLSAPREARADEKIVDLVGVRRVDAASSGPATPEGFLMGPANAGCAVLLLGDQRWRGRTDCALERTMGRAAATCWRIVLKRAGQGAEDAEAQ